MQPDTQSVHAFLDEADQFDAVAPPIYLSTTFAHGPANESASGYRYIRGGSPTVNRLERALATLEGGEAALAFGSGTAAASTLFQTMEPGARVLFHRDMYHDFRRMVGRMFPRWGLEAKFLDFRNDAQLEAALEEGADLLWCETPSNPVLEVLDIAALAELAHGAGARLCIDGTFASPALQNPLRLGADAVMHSATKYLGGHSDVLGGALIFRDGGEWPEAAEAIRGLSGGNLAPFNAWLVGRGLSTLYCRMDRHSGNAMAIAAALDGHQRLSAVHYPGLKSHPGYEIAARQMRAPGGMMAIEVEGGRAPALEAAGKLRLIRIATSLGGTESLIEHRASIEGDATRAPESLLRLSVGLENPEDLIADLMQALG